ncbi:hypothetical protein GUITHDRAFT_135087 [Guillardia theta CCMP2712]|uniref:Uncharacterized protein n=1 Tax=Guillardia theta (strain CCMP2712) TaxID=905079 RepID=L1JQ51_GUITC|nr:hypothetical protein GUITHDRAFT_135087 [Guillardia theta CCMP2712]EKX50399.1 hypothetical protein GUITHDRAFT_135087 [Guillardia theta CCMP2712]|eukprot:XP_005837379.1 hypothetical protein GUITHDRAFT_135087 [Guillardia theta CCMP2712]
MLPCSLKTLLAAAFAAARAAARAPWPVAPASSSMPNCTGISRPVIPSLRSCPLPLVRLRGGSSVSLPADLSERLSLYKDIVQRSDRGEDGKIMTMLYARELQEIARLINETARLMEEKRDETARLIKEKEAINEEKRNEIARLIEEKRNETARLIKEKRNEHKWREKVYSSNLAECLEK